MLRGKVNSPLPTLAVGQVSTELQFDTSGRLVTSGSQGSRGDILSPGTSWLHRKATADTNLVSIKGTAGKIVGGIITNTSAATKFVKFYNKAIAPVTGTDTPVVVFPIPTLQQLDLSAVVEPYGLYFPLGIGMAITGAVADNDATALVANDVIANIQWV